MPEPIAGFDFVICDMEHAQISEPEARTVIKACAAVGLAVIVRLPEPIQGLVNRLLEAGAVGIQMPRLRTRQETRSLYEMMHYPPQGARSVGNTNSGPVMAVFPCPNILKNPTTGPW